MADPTRSIPRPQPRPLARSADLREASAPGRLRPLPRPEGLGETPVAVAEGATVRDALRLDRTALIGLFSGPEGGSALLRLASGDVVRAAPGDVVECAVVTAIAEDELRLWRDGEETVLTMPA